MTRVGAALAAGILVVGGLTPVSAQAADPPYRPRACETRFSGGDGSDPWQVDRLQIPQLHQIATGKGVTVAVLDTGVFAGSSPYLTGVDLVTKYNFTGTNKATEGRVDCYHGTFVVSVLAAQPGADPNSDFSGIAPDVEVIAMRVLQRSSQSPNDLEPLDPVVDAVNKAVDLGVDIISISQQGTDRADYKAAIKRAVDAGILVVAASGNNGASGPTYPANYPGVMAVAMTTRSDVPDEASQYGGGMKISVAAPGTDVVGLMPTCVTAIDDNCPSGQGPATYNTETGTSFATPLVAGAAALVMERFPDLSAAEVKQLLEETADPPVGGVPDTKIGHGIINPYRALMGPRPPAPPSGEASQAGDVHIPPVHHDVDHTVRNTALAVAGGSLGLMAIIGVVAAALPGGRKRRWQPAERDPQHH